MSDSPRVTTETKPRRAKKRARRTDRVVLSEAYRVRAGAIGLLACCTCTFPIKQHATPTRHALDCQSHTMTLSAIKAGTYTHFSFGDP